jgi:hypothetical protein
MVQTKSLLHLSIRTRKSGKSTCYVATYEYIVRGVRFSGSDVLDLVGRRRFDIGQHIQGSVLDFIDVRLSSGLLPLSRSGFLPLSLSLAQLPASRFPTTRVETERRFRKPKPCRALGG